MAILLVLTIIIVVLTAAAIKPKWAAVMVWPIVLLYPHGWWWRANLTPYRMGYDDFLIICMLIIVCFRLRLNRGRPIELGWAGRMYLIYTLILGVSTLFGVLHSGIPQGTSTLFIKEMLKGGIMVGVFAMLANAVDTRREWLRVVKGINFTMLLAGLLVIISYYNPGIRSIFTSPSDAERIAGGWVTERAAGAFAEPNTAGALLAAGVILMLFDIRVSVSLLWKGLMWVGIGVSAAGILYTQSRTGLFALLLVPGLLLFVNGSKKYAVIAMAAGTLLAIALPQYWAPVLARAAHSFDPASQYGNIMGRVKHWVDYLGDLSVLTLVAPKGPTITRLLIGQKPHNGFLDIVAWFGLYGVMWAALAIYGISKRLHVLKGSEENSSLYEFRKYFWVFAIVWLVPMMTMDTFSPGFLTILFFFSMLWLLGQAAELSHVGVYDAGEVYEVVWGSHSALELAGVTHEEEWC